MKGAAGVLLAFVVGAAVILGFAWWAHRLRPVPSQVEPVHPEVRRFSPLRWDGGR